MDSAIQNIYNLILTQYRSALTKTGDTRKVKVRRILIAGLCFKAPKANTCIPSMSFFRAGLVDALIYALIWKKRSPRISKCESALPRRTQPRVSTPTLMFALLLLLLTYNGWKDGLPCVEEPFYMA